MDNICCWNVRGLNWPNKQEDIKLFLHTYHIGLIGMLETKVKLARVNKVASNLLAGWQWLHNFDTGYHGRIWIAWKPQYFHVELLGKSSQHMHCKVLNHQSSHIFYMTFVYAHNQEGLRSPLWEELK